MIQPQRIALFSSQKEIETYYGQRADSISLFEPHYNMAPAHPVLVLRNVENGSKLERIRWGLAPAEQQNQKHTVSVEEAEKEIQSGKWDRALLPISGFYLWKKEGKRAEQPFFVRLLNESVMSVAGVVARDKRSGTVLGCAMMRVASSHLISPLSREMPLLLDRELSQEWLNGEISPDELKHTAEGLYSVVDMSVLRVSKKVNDLTKNSPELIQPLPK